MPTRSSETSEGTSQRPPRRRTTTRTTATKRRTPARPRKAEDAETGEETVSEAEVSESMVPVADDFGEGVENEPRPVRRAERRPLRSAPSKDDSPAADSEKPVSGRTTSSRRPLSRAEPAEHSSAVDDGPQDEAAAKSDAGPPRQLAFFSSDEIDFGDGADADSEADYDDFPPGEPGSGEGGEDGDRRPRRRRRRRRRNGVSDVRTAPADNRGAVDSRSGGSTQDSRGGSTQDSRGGSLSGRGADAGRTDRSRGRRRGGRGGDDRRRSGGGGSRDRTSGAPRRARQVQPTGEVIEGTFEGVLELHPKGYGFLRDPRKNYAAEDSNPFVSSSVVEKYKLREGVLIRGDVGQGTRNQGPRLQEVELIDGYTPEEYTNIKLFDDLTPINPFEQIRLETGPRPLTMRVMDLLCPIGKGQRALLVAPPRTGKTMLLQDIANSVSENHPEIHLVVLLIDERPEEVTEMRRLVNGEVVSSSLDSDVESHIRISQLIIERGKRLAEEGKDVFILLDSITRMARAFNKWSNSGRTATGGLDIRALDIPKKLFGTARRFDEGGSLTVCGTALIDTGSRMDEAIFQEFKGTGNMEMVLSRDLADRRIWPSIDVSKSGTRREEKILAPDVLEGTTLLRRSLISLNPVEAMEQLTRTMEKFPTNKEFLQKIRAIL